MSLVYRYMTTDSNSTITFSYLLSIHEPLLLCEIEDFHRDVELRARFIRDAAIVITDHTTFAAGHLKPRCRNRGELMHKQKHWARFKKETAKQEYVFIPQLHSQVLPVRRWARPACWAAALQRPPPADPAVLASFSGHAPLRRLLLRSYPDSLLWL